MSDGTSEKIDPKICPVCKEKHLCMTCSKPLEHDAKKFCLECKSYQDWRGHLTGLQIPLAMLTAIISVIGSGYTLWTWAHRESHTSAAAISASTENISMYAWNNGQYPSVVLQGKLRYTEDKTQDAPVEIKSTTIPPNSVSIIEVKPPPPTFKPVGSSKVILTVRESNDNVWEIEVPLDDDFVKQLDQRYGVTQGSS